MISLIPNTQNISSKNKYKESITRSYKNFFTPPFFLVVPPNNIRNSHWKCKAKPCHESYFYPTILRNSLYEASKRCNHKYGNNKLSEEHFPHSNTHFLHFFFWKFFISMMNLHPEFSKNRSMPECSSKKWNQGQYQNRYPVEFHTKK